MQSSGSQEQRFVAPDMGRALRILGEELGPDAVLLSSRKVSEGVEIVALPPGAEAPEGDYAALHSDRRVKERRSAERRSDTSANDSTSNDSTTNDVTTNDVTTSVDNESDTASSIDMSSAASRLAKSIGDLTAGSQGIASESERSAFENLQSELTQVRQMLEQKITAMAPASPVLPQPVQYVLINRLLQTGMPMDLAQAITQAVISDEQHGDVEQAWRQCRDYLMALMPVADQDLVATGGVIALLGPSGAGKSSAIAKLAAAFMLEHSAADVAIISHDSGSTAGAGRLSRFSGMTGIPVFYVDHEHSLADRIAQCSKQRLVLIDTVGKAEENTEAVAQLQSVTTRKQVKSLIVLPAIGEASWLGSMIQSYRGENTVGCILSHMDQAASVGAVLSQLLKAQLPIHYLSHGGLLPKYIQRPQRQWLLDKLLATEQHDELADMLTPPLMSNLAASAQAQATDTSETPDTKRDNREAALSPEDH